MARLWSQICRPLWSLRRLCRYQRTVPCLSAVARLCASAAHTVSCCFSVQHGFPGQSAVGCFNRPIKFDRLNVSTYTNNAFVYLQVKLVQHVYSGLFGTFLTNTAQETENENLRETTFSVWSLMLHCSSCVNGLYKPVNGVR